MFGIRDESAFKAAGGLHGGIGGQGDVCGSLMGASLMIGLICGKTIEESGNQEPPDGPPAGPPPLDDATRLVGEIYKWFEKEFGSVKCREVRGRFEQEVDAGAGPEGLTDKERIDRVHSRCDRLAGITSARTAEMLWDEINGSR